MLAKNYRRWTADPAKGPGPDHFYTGNASVRREHVLRVGGFDEDLKRQEDMRLRTGWSALAAYISALNQRPSAFTGRTGAYHPGWTSLMVTVSLM